MSYKITFTFAICLTASFLNGCSDLVDKAPPSGLAQTPAPGSSQLSSNTPPSISGNPNPDALIGQTWIFAPTAADVDGNPISFAIENQPVWASFDQSTGQLSGVPQLGQQGRYAGISISATDGEATTTLPPFSVTVFSTSTNSAPVISGLPPEAVAVGSQYVFQPAAMDPDGDPLIFAINGLPAWAGFDIARGRIEGTPVGADAGMYTGVVVSVSDGQQVSALPEFSIEVRIPTLPNNAPVISGNAPITGQTGEDYLFIPGASDADGDNLTFAITNRPAWASFDTTSGALSGTPNSGDAGLYQGIVISVNDGQSSTALPEFAITIQDTVVPNSAPRISGSPSLRASVGQPYVFQPNATDPDGDVLTFAISNRPAWASFNAITGMLTGIATPNDEGSHRNIVVSVGDGEFSATLPAFTIRVDNPDANEAPEITGNPSPTVTVGDFYNFQPAATDPDGDDLTFSITNRPVWSSFDTATGRLSGSVVESDEGFYGNISISVSDGSLSDSLGDFEISVLADESNEPPTISGNPNTSATVDQFYSFQPEAADPDGDNLSFSISNQPAWASFDANTGLLSGTPSQVDAMTFDNIRISVSDGELSATLAAFSIDVAQVATGSVTLRWTAPTLNTDGSTLTDLAAYKIYYGNSPGNYPSEERIDNPGLTIYVIENLSPGTYYFVVSSINEQETESAPSNEASKVID